MMELTTTAKRPKILMIGTDPASKGGISSVIRMYEQGGLFKKSMYLSSYTDGGAIKKLLYYGGFLGRFLSTLMQKPSLELIHIHTASYASFTRKSLVVLLAKLFGKKVILHVHGAEFSVFYQKSGFFRQKWISGILNRCDCLIALSTQWKQDLLKISPKANVRVLYNPTILRNVSFEPGLPHQDESVKFLFMGRIGKRKGVYDILESMQRVNASNVEIHLYGDGEIEQLQTLVAQKGLENSVKVCGWIDGSRKDSTFRDANVLLLPSYNEGLPISVLEAMAYGLPVLATDVGGIAEAVEEGKNGFLIKPGECMELTERIERLANSADLRLKMGQAGYEIAAERFSLPVIIEQLESLYDEFTQP